MRIGNAVAAMSGTQFAIQMDVTWFGAIFLGVMTAVTGGLLRDVLCQLEPVLLHRETIATCTLVGSAVYVGLQQSGTGDNRAALIGGAVVVITRLVSIKFDLHLPKFKN